ncbi:UDP-N-acetylmuramoyl-L-alanine--D-glutamate ligase [Polycladidibacter stylochi]|uniref:UDP-N-acetylmuramoyl-L-alanine--D-glutamate ligase n=1 Tax=Polycladidibacter stylochi TaxID=1807766 RepID=UPI00082F2DCD|nr:UDP-N-acetylmuramoyl-L-alanine--D-glutamate ligase [Pseudovibrio stylochi]
MIPVTTMSGKDVAVFGLGGSGLVTAKALVAGGARVDVWDDNPERTLAAEEAGLDVIDLQDADFGRYEALVLAPGVPLTHPEPHWSVKKAQENGVEVIGDVELFQREREAKCPDAAFVAITGTNGKSTSTALISHLLRHAGFDVQMGGNIGRPVLDLDPLSEERVYVVECSSYQIDLAPSLAPDIGVLLNLSPDHLDRHGDMAHYGDVKSRLVRASRLAIVGVDDDYCATLYDRLLENGEQSVDAISSREPVQNGVYYTQGTVVEACDGDEIVMADLEGCRSLRGAHNGQNAAAAVAVTSALGLSRGEIAEGLESFPGLEHRAQVVAQAGHVLFVNDSKATNAEASAHALASYDHIFWIAGGRPKAGGISSLKQYYPNMAKAYLIGEAAEEFAQSLEGHVETQIFASLESAVRAAADDARASKHNEAVVLLSPACASFDMFSSFEERGHAFCEAAQEAAEAMNIKGEK